MSELPLPLAALAQHIIALGKTRSGKSTKLRVIVEHLLERQHPVCIIDPKGDWWGLKSSANGKTSGYPIVIFGGEHADVPLNPHAGAHVAELVATGNRSCLIDLGGWMVADRTRFFIDFASTLFKLTRGQRYLVIDECHNFAPKGRIFDPDAGKALHWANRLASEGQGKGLVLIAASQRPQKVHNDFLTSCETLIACRVIHKADRDAIKDWIDGCADPSTGREVLASLAQMQRSDAWVWSPEVDFGPKQITFPMFRTYDSFKPQPADLGKLKGWADVDLEDVKAKLATVVKEAEANDPRKLKARIAELERDLANAEGAVMNVTAMTDRERRLEVENEQQAERIAALEADNRTLEQHRDAIAAAFERLQKQADGARTKLLGFADELFVMQEELPPFPAITKPSAPAPAAGPMRTSPSVRPAATSAPRLRTNGAGPGLPKPQAAILRALYWLRDEERTAEKVAFYAGYSVSSSSFANALGALRSAGLVERWGVTFEGEKLIAPHAGKKPSGAELREWVRPKLGKAENALLDVLVAAGGRSIENRALAESSGYSITSSSFANAIGRLRTIGAAVGYDRDGGARAAEVFLA